jgi:hypothetical protein
MGRPPKLTPHQKKEALRRSGAEEATREIGRLFNMSPNMMRATLSSAAKA